MLSQMTLEERLAAEAQEQANTPTAVRISGGIRELTYIPKIEGKDGISRNAEEVESEQKRQRREKEKERRRGKRSVKDLGLINPLRWADKKDLSARGS